MKKFIVIAAVIALALAVCFLRPPRPAQPAVRFDSPQPRPAHTAAPRAVVYVAGHVAHPGLYTLSAGARVDDAIRAAGGIARDADPVAVNLAEHVADGEEIAVPEVGASPEMHPRHRHSHEAGSPRRRRRRAVPTVDGDVAGNSADGVRDAPTR
ncbi:MAG TPA: SLBB domain-containing protein [Candidatus Binatia bacterium]|nr:SLBB domain-containing protein [Candidatus Binatia bacterium]